MPNVHGNVGRGVDRRPVDPRDLGVEARRPHVGRLHVDRFADRAHRCAITPMPVMPTSARRRNTGARRRCNSDKEARRVAVAMMPMTATRPPYALAAIAIHQMSRIPAAITEVPAVDRR